MLVTVEELGKTSLYPEIINKITRDDRLAAELQILAAESLVRQNMHRYDLDAIFGTTDSEPTFKGGAVDHIKKIIKIIASYYLVRLSNPNIDIELFREDYEDAIDWLKKLKDGDIPIELPYGEYAGDAWWASNVKRKQNFD